MIPQGKITGGFTQENCEAIQSTLREAVQRALLAHKRAGVPIVVSRDGKVVEIPPEEIPVDDPLKSNRTS